MSIFSTRVNLQASAGVSNVCPSSALPLSDTLPLKDRPVCPSAIPLIVRSMMSSPASVRRENCTRMGPDEEVNPAQAVPSLPQFSSETRAPCRFALNVPVPSVRQFWAVASSATVNRETAMKQQASVRKVKKV